MIKWECEMALRNCVAISLGASACHVTVHDAKGWLTERLGVSTWKNACLRENTSTEDLGYWVGSFQDHVIVTFVPKIQRYFCRSRSTSSSVRTTFYHPK